MTLDENLQLLHSTKQNIKTALNDKMPESADNKQFGEYHSIVDGFKKGSNNIEDYTITDSTRLSEYTGKNFIFIKCIKSVNIPVTVTSLGSDCFKYCSSLLAVIIPDSVTSLGGWCFYGCSSLTCIIIPDSVTSLGDRCFQYCSSLTSVTCKATTPPTLGSTAFSSTNSTLVIYVPAESVDAYKAATNWSNYADKIQAIAS